MPEKKTPLLYRLLKGLVRLVYPKTELVGEENLPEEPAIIVSNHAQMHGPIACELYFPGKRYIWCVGQMMHLKEVPDYAFQDFWSQKPKWCRWFYRLLSYLIAPLSVFIFNAGPSIPVYRDARLITTFKMSIDKLQGGASIIIFPEHDVPHNNIIFEFQDKFIDIAKVYYKKTGRELSFVPMYIAPALKKMYIGKPIRFCAEAPIKEERQRICDYLMQEITDIARSLPEHKVVPYRNVPKKFYPSNISKEADTNEKTCC